MPVHELLGGPVRDRVRAYVWIAGDDFCAYSPEAIIAETLAWVGKGFTAFKLTPPKAYAIGMPSEGTAIVDRLAALREAIGPDSDIALDVHGQWSKTMARRILPPLDPSSCSSSRSRCCPRTSTSSGADAETSLPIATGERLFAVGLPRRRPSGIAVIQPDVSEAGGISETRRIAALAETYDVIVAPHCPLGPVTLAASLQIDFATPNILIQEQGITFFGDASSATSRTRRSSTSTTVLAARPGRPRG